MTNLIATLKSAAANLVLFFAATVLAGVVFAFVGTLALFALAAMGIGLIAAPFIAQRAEAEPTTYPPQ